MKKCLVFTLFIFTLLLVFKITFSQGNWEQKTVFDTTARFDAVSFTIDGNAYVGLGEYEDSLLADFHKYGAQTNNWSPIAMFPGEPRKEAVAFSINGKGYVGLGTDGYPDYNRYKDFYRYDPSTNTWTQISDFGGSARNAAIVFVIDGYAYVGTGKDASGSTKDFWKYDPSDDTWSQVSDLASSKRYGATGFSINGKGYVCAGKETSSSQLSGVYEYNPDMDSWTEKIYADGMKLGFEGASSFVAEGKAYICYGNQDYISKYNPSDNSVNKLGDVLNYGDNLNSPIGFELDGKGYVGLGKTGFFDVTYHKDIWQFTPPNPPTAIHLSDTTIPENNPEDTLVGVLSTEDADENDTHTYSLVDGTGSYGEGNANFDIIEDSLKINISANYELKDSFLINIQVEDSEGLTYDRGFEIIIEDKNEEPGWLFLSSDEIKENQDIGSIVGTLSNEDPDTGDSHVYSFSNTDGNEDSTYFAFEGNKLVTDSILDYESKKEYNLNIKCTDSSGLSAARNFNIKVADVNEPPYELSIYPDSVKENASIGTTVGSFITSDPDYGLVEYDYELVTGNGTNDQDNSLFTIQGDELIVDDTLDYEKQEQCNIYVRTTDNGGLSYEEALIIYLKNVEEEESDDSDDDEETGISETGKKQFAVYPNPTHGSVRVNIDQTIYQQGMKVILLDSKGTLLKSEIISKPEFNISLLGLSDGIYFIRLSDQHKESAIKIIKE